jgi:hypothetical protein
MRFTIIMYCCLLIYPEGRILILTILLVCQYNARAILTFLQYSYPVYLPSNILFAYNAPTITVQCNILVKFLKSSQMKTGTTI